MLNFDDNYISLPNDEVFAKIKSRKEQLAGQLTILAHHYQCDEIFQFADFTGDSLKLSQQAADQKQAKWIVFCGVHFMAEVARMLCDEKQHIILPEMSAGCSMADMAKAEQVEVCWDIIEKQANGRKIVPITYINSSADIKAFCGQHDGAICTSGNAVKLLSWALDHGQIVLFLPDQHLGRNTAKSFGIDLDQMINYDPNTQKLSGPIADNTRMILWSGFCNVHMKFSMADIQRIRKQNPKTKIIVHPECSFDVVEAADEAGSTEYILQRIRQADAGIEPSWAIGTESTMVNRLSAELSDSKDIRCLSDEPVNCPTMQCTTANKLLWVLDNLANGEIVNEIFVDPKIAKQSQLALDRMLQLK